MRTEFLEVTRVINMSGKNKSVNVTGRNQGEQSYWKKSKLTELLEEIKVNRVTGRNKSKQSYWKE
jgi:hypothetical protein